MSEIKDISEEIKLNPVSALSEEDIAEPEDKGVKADELELEEEQEESADVKTVKFTLRLGDVIVIKAPTNEILNDGTFLVEYIDKEKMKLIKKCNVSLMFCILLVFL